MFDIILHFLVIPFAVQWALCHFHKKRWPQWVPVVINASLIALYLTIGAVKMMNHVTLEYYYNAPVFGKILQEFGLAIFHTLEILPLTGGWMLAQLTKAKMGKQDNN